MAGSSWPGSGSGRSSSSISSRISPRAARAPTLRARGPPSGGSTRPIAATNLAFVSRQANLPKLLVTSGLADPLEARLAAGLPVLGTCAGMILLARTVLDGRDDQRSYDAIDITVRRNAFGRQVDSFEADLPVAGLDRTFHAVFIRAPFVEDVGADVEVLASVGGHPVLCRSGRVLVTAFHPELTPDRRIHQLFLSLT